MADIVLRLLSRILTLSESDRRRLQDYVAASAPIAALPNAERQRRYRERKRLPGVTERNGFVVTGRNGDGVTERNVTTVTPRNASDVTQRNEIPLEPPVFTSITKSFPAFESFWKAYPKHIGKGEAYKAWKQGNCEAKAEFILTAVGAQTAYFQAQGPKYTPNPATWLNQKRWDDEPPMPSLLGEKTRGNMASLQAFVKEVQRDAT